MKAKRKSSTKRNPRARRRANPRLRARGEAKLIDKAKRLAKKKSTRRQSRALFAEARRRGYNLKSPKKIRVRRSNPEQARFIIVAIPRGKKGRLHPMFWTGKLLTTQRDAAMPYSSLKDAGDMAKWMQSRLPPKIHSIEVRRKN